MKLEHTYGTQPWSVTIRAMIEVSLISQHQSLEKDQSLRRHRSLCLIDVQITVCLRTNFTRMSLYIY